MSHRVILSVAVDGNENARYVHFQNRLKESISTHWKDAETIYWTGKYPPGSPTHTESPYAFKLYAIKAALARGYTTVVWMDAGVYAIKDIEPFLQAVEECGIYIVQDDNALGKFCSQETFDYYGMTRDQAKELGLHIACGALIGLDFTKQKTKDLFADWLKAYEAGLYRGTYSRHSGMEDHRGDESILGILMHRHKIPFHNIQQHFSSDAPIRETTIFRSGYQ